MRINSRNKVAAGERDFFRVLQDHLGARLVRNLERSRRGGHDLAVIEPNDPLAVALDHFSIKAKMRLFITQAMLMRFWRQTEAQARSVEKVPVLAYRADRKSWRVLLPMAAINPGLHWESFGSTVDMDVERFASIVREYIEVTS